MPRLSLALLLPAVVLIAVACGDDDDADSPPAAEPSPGQTIIASGPPLSDKAYLTVVCQNLEQYSGAVETASTAGELGEAIDAWIAAMSAAVPPEDLEQFHRDFLDYLRAAVDDPTRPLVTEPPVPPDDVRERLAALEAEVDECRDPTFFSSGTSETTGTP